MTSPEWPPVSDAEVEVPITCGRCGWVGKHGTLWKHVRDVHEPVDPSTAEVEAAAEAILTLSYPRSRWSDCSPIMRTNFIEVARAALTAARSALPEAGTVFEAVSEIESELLASADAGIDLGDEYLRGMHSALTQVRERAARTTPPTPPPEAGTVEAAAVVESFVKRMDEVYDSFPDDTHEQFLEGWLRAVGEIEVNLRYHVDPSLRTTPPTPPSEAGEVERLRERVRILEQQRGEAWEREGDAVADAASARSAVEAAVAAERERITQAIEAQHLQPLDLLHKGKFDDTWNNAISEAARIARTPTATEGG